MEEKKPVDKVNEPIQPYGRIRFFNSFEEENEYTHRMRASYTPAENMDHAISLIKTIYREQLKGYKPDNRIHFD